MNWQHMDDDERYAVLYGPQPRDDDPPDWVDVAIRCLLPSAFLLVGFAVWELMR
jgi:hypothetical protein